MIRFSKYLWIYMLISASILIPGIFSLFKWGLKPSIDFAGGSLIEIRQTQPDFENKIIKDAQKKNISVSSIQKTGAYTYLLRSKESDSKKITDLIKASDNQTTPSAQIIREESVGPVLGSELLLKAVIAAIIAIIGILLYVAYAFKNIQFGLAAIIALLHDLLVVAGSFSLLGHFLSIEVDTLFVTAILTTMSFSVHDTIVVFDRIREYLKKDTRTHLEEVVDRALTETMGRSLANSVTIMLMLIALILLGGENVRWFAVALLIGTISGTYSSPFVATPILVIWHRLIKK